MEKANRSVVANSLGGKGEKAMDGAQGISGSEGVLCTIIVDTTGIFKTQGTCNTNKVAWCVQIKKENHSGCQGISGKKPDRDKRI